MKPEKLIEIMHDIEQLKNNTRHSWTSSGRHESVAEHSFRLILMAYFVKDEFADLDMEKVIKMCMFHDIGEAFTGDIPSFDKKDSDEEKEGRAVQEWISGLPENYQEEIKELIQEMDELRTNESKLYKALDKMECLIQHNEADISTWIPKEYQLNFIYGAENVEHSSYLTELRAEINRQCQDKIDKNT